ncbi:MAG TPA: glycoside hydrolase family 38 C-terminal domain-containing protein [Verrucomicrobiae bacterium]|nr:glycoside hydrolase family 38 C-terminal domain-containing protein [Verrucomicrobiae bacterium]
MKFRLPATLSHFLFCAATALAAAHGAGSPDLSRERVLYTIGYTHLDTQWRWVYPITIREYLTNTVYQNGKLFEKYPNYLFNWTGAYRYQLMKEYHPADYEKVRGWVAQGRWFPCGNSWDECDVNVPSTESIIRQILHGHHYFKREFGTESIEFMLPDCFGFPASLPSILAHCGLRGFSTQKLRWGSAVGIPFNVGIWEGLDGQGVIAALNTGDYNESIKTNLSVDPYWEKRLDENGRKSGVLADYQFHGVGDQGGGPREESVIWLEKSLATTGAVRVISAKADQMFRDITDEQMKHLPRYQGDLLLTEHSAGCLSSQAYMKRWNRANELLADAAERASVAAHLLGGATYPREKLKRAWQLVLAGQMHDILPGTSLPLAYQYSWNDQVIAMNSFASVLQDAVGAVARALDTQVEGLPLVIYNPLSIERDDVVEAEVEWDSMEGVQVVDGKGRAVPTQVLSQSNGLARILFVARVPSIGFAVYGVKATKGKERKSSLRVTERELENARYRVTLNDGGDIASVFDKSLKKELLQSPARLEFRREVPQAWPAWNMDWQDRTNAPMGYVDGPAQIRIVENGPVRVALEVQRSARGSDFVQTIRLALGGERVEIANRIAWQTTNASLKATFPLTVSNPRATYNWGLGKIQRGNNDPKKYEVPSHQWLDLTDENSKAGVSILSGHKYGSDKPSDDVLRLTLLYSPGVRTNVAYREQATQDWGRHEFVYGLTSHKGDWRAGNTDWQAARQDQPLLAFRTTRHAGQLGRSFSLLQVNSDAVAVRAVKLAENSDQVIVRLQELDGQQPVKATLTSAARIESAVAVNGVERELAKLSSGASKLSLEFKPFQLRSVALDMQPLAMLQPPTSTPVALPFNLDVFSWNTNRADGKCDNSGVTMPAEMIGDRVTTEGITFNIGSRMDGQMNAVSCDGQKVTLPETKFDRVYVLATAVHGDSEGEFAVDGRAVNLRVSDWSGYLGSWDNRVFEGGRVFVFGYSVNNPVTSIAPGFIKRDPLAWFCSHRHFPQRDEEYRYSYLFKYRLDVPNGAKTLTLPKNNRIRVLAVSVAQNDNDKTVPAQPLYDDFTGRTVMELNRLN